MSSIDSTRDNKIFFGFLALLIWIPLPLGSNRLWSASILVISATLLLSFWCFKYIRQQVSTTRSFRKGWPITSLLIISNVWVGIQAGVFSFIPFLQASSIEPLASLQHFTLGWGLIAVFVLALLLLNTHNRIRKTAYVLVGCGLFQALYGGVMTLSGVEYTFFIPKDSYEGVATGTFINRNHLAGYLVICLSIGLGMMIATLKDGRSGSWRNRIRNLMTALLGTKALLRISLIIMVIGLVLTHSRMGNTSFFAAMMITGVLALVMSRNASRSTVILLSSLLVIDILIVGTFFGVDKVVDRLEQTTTQRETRDEVDLYSIKLLEKHLVKGTGAGTFYTAFPEYRGGDIRIFYADAHNDYLEFLSERGLIGFIPLLLAAALSFIVAVRAHWKRKNKLMRGLSFGAIMSMIAMSMHATVDFNLQIPANAAMFMMILAFAWISMFHKEKLHKERGHRERDRR